MTLFICQVCQVSLDNYLNDVLLSYFMKWKEFPLWLKGGILIFPILLCLALLVGFLFLILNGGTCTGGPCPACLGCACPSSPIYCFTPAFGTTLILPSFPVAWILDRDSFIGSSFYNILYNFFVWFLIGALIGWLVQKIKN